MKVLRADCQAGHAGGELSERDWYSHCQIETTADHLSLPSSKTNDSMRSIEYCLLKMPVSFLEYVRKS